MKFLTNIEEKQDIELEIIFLEKKLEYKILQ
jgi:hypothetical protein